MRSHGEAHERAGDVARGRGGGAQSESRRSRARRAPGASRASARRDATVLIVLGRVPSLSGPTVQNPRTMLVIDKRLRRAIARAAPCGDERTLAKLLRGEQVRGRAAVRAHAALTAAGIMLAGPDGTGDGAAARAGSGGLGGGSLAVRRVAVVEVQGLLQAETSAVRLFVSAQLLEQLAAKPGRWRGRADTVQVLRIIDLLEALRYGKTTALDDSHTAAEADGGVAFVAGRDNPGVLLLQRPEEITTTVAGAVLDVVAEMEWTETPCARSSCACWGRSRERLARGRRRARGSSLAGAPGYRVRAPRDRVRRRDGRGPPRARGRRRGGNQRRAAPVERQRADPTATRRGARP